MTLTNIEDLTAADPIAELNAQNFDPTNADDLKTTKGRRKSHIRLEIAQLNAQIEDLKARVGDLRDQLKGA
jgi:hypothetical protein